MEFSEAITLMEKGTRITRPGWLGYLFLDIDDRIKHAGEKGKHERFWKIDFCLKDWEEYIGMKGNTKETEAARIESLMETNSAHINRLYYLEEIICTQNNEFKKISDNINFEMDETRKIVSQIAKHIPSMSKSMESFPRFSIEINKIANAIRSINKEIDKISKRIAVNEKQLKSCSKTDNNDFTKEEKVEMEEVRKKLEKRKDAKAVMAPKLSK